MANTLTDHHWNHPKKETMKKGMNIPGLAVLVLLILGACSTNDSEDQEPIRLVSPPTADAFDLIRAQAMGNLVQTFDFDVADGTISWESEAGVTLQLNPSCLSLNGEAVTGVVSLNYVELFDRAQMAITNSPTMGVTDSGDKSLLISGGEFNVQVLQGSARLTLNCPFSLIVPGDRTGGIDHDMTLWTGTRDDDGTLEWEEDDAGNDQERLLMFNGSDYLAIVQNFGWTNIDRFYNDPRPKTTLKVRVPDGFDFENCAVYLSYDGEGNALAHLDSYDSDAQAFTEHYGQIPIGLECHLIFMSEDGGEYRFGSKAVTIAADTIYEFTDADTSVMTESEVVQAITDLP